MVWACILCGALQIQPACAAVSDMRYPPAVLSHVDGVRVVTEETIRMPC